MCITFRALGTMSTSRTALIALLASGALAAPLAAQSNEELKQELAAERAARLALEKRLADIEAKVNVQQESDAEAQLRKLIAPEDLARAPKTTVFPGASNPAIGVFANAVLEGGNFDSKLGANSDRFSMRETEVDMRLPLSPFAEGALIVPFSDNGDGTFSGTIEEGYANVGLGKLLDTDWDTTVKIGRSKPIFGRNNQLHGHDWLQVNQPLPVENLLGEDGIAGDGFNFHTPIAHTGSTVGEGRTTTLDWSIMNGEILTSEGALPDLADADGVTLASDRPMLVARTSEFMELGQLSDLEMGLSTLQRLGSTAVTAGPAGGIGTETKLDPTYWDADVTWRSRDDETGIGSWLVQAEAIHSTIDYGDTGVAGFPTGTENRDGWWLTTQRQTSPTTYLGLLYAQSDELGNTNRDTSVSPYLTWYADEFFRIRWQLDFQNKKVHDGPDVNGAYRALMQFTWNFGVHQPHPYWVNK